MRFRDRVDAGRRLAALLEDRVQQDAQVLALPRGGVPVGDEVAAHLRLPLDVMLVRKLGLPGHEEYAMGAIASGGAEVLNEGAFAHTRPDPAAVAAVRAREQAELARREQVYRGDAPMPDLAGRDVIVVDDGLATGSTMRAAIRALRQFRPSRVVVAVPVAPPETVAVLAAEADAVVCLLEPEPFYGVGYWYEDFAQTSDDEVCALLRKHRAEVRPPLQNHGGEHGNRQL